MKFLFFFIIILLMISCTNKKQVYWCGDHQCINKKERSAYFKKTMIVEIKDLSKNDKKNISELEKTRELVVLGEKKRIKEEKALAKQVRLDEKKRIKEEKVLVKRKKSSKKKIVKKKKKLSKKKVEQEISLNLNNFNTDSSEFNFFVEKINEKSKFKPYPDINISPN